MDFPFGLKRAATLCILKHEQQFLLLKRAKEPHKGMFTPVGGKIDPHESPKAAAIRETREETGIVLTDMTYCGLLTETSPVKYNWICFTYLAEVPMMKPPICHEGWLEWIPYKNLFSISTPKTDAFIYQYVMKGQVFSLDARFDKNLELLEIVEEISGENIYQKTL